MALDVVDMTVFNGDVLPFAINCDALRIGVYSGATQVTNVKTIYSDITYITHGNQ
ncbi:hypothetical protein D3C71_2034140 [compost metagenome]